jgi:DNA-binding NarL/FixJ family response regulator
MLRVLIADDHPIVREGLKRLIQDEFQSAVVEEAGSGREAISKICDQSWNVVTLDIKFPDKSGLDVLKEAKVLRVTLPIIVLSVYPEEQYALRAFKAGADASLTKESAPYELMEAIHTVCKGRKFVKPAIAAQWVMTRGNEPLVSQSPLSDRELEVLRMFVNGSTSKEIGHALVISEKTVSTYRSRILTKLRLRTTVDLIRYALDQGLTR